MEFTTRIRINRESHRRTGLHAADIALIDPDAEVTVGEGGFRSKSRNSAWTGETLHGRVALTIAGGQIAWRP